MMNKHIKKAMEIVKAAIPASGFRPETPMEWEALQLANEELSYAMFRENGMTNTQARQLAQLICRGPAGRLLLEVSFKDDSHA